MFSIDAVSIHSDDPRSGGQKWQGRILFDNYELMRTSAEFMDAAEAMKTVREDFIGKFHSLLASQS